MRSEVDESGLELCSGVQICNRCLPEFHPEDLEVDLEIFLQSGLWEPTHCPNLPQVRTRSIAAQPTMATAQPSTAALEGKLAINVVGTVMTAAMRCWDCIMAGCCRYCSAYCPDSIALLQWIPGSFQLTPISCSMMPHNILLEFYWLVKKCQMSKNIATKVPLDTLRRRRSVLRKTCKHPNAHAQIRTKWAARADLLAGKKVAICQRWMGNGIWVLFQFHPCTILAKEFHSSPRNAGTEFYGIFSALPQKRTATTQNLGVAPYPTNDMIRWHVTTSPGRVVWISSRFWNKKSCHNSAHSVAVMISHMLLVHLALMVDNEFK